MTGEAIKAGNVKLSHSIDEILNGEIACLLGHAESFMSDQGETIILKHRLQIYW